MYLFMLLDLQNMDLFLILGIQNMHFVFAVISIVVKMIRMVFKISQDALQSISALMVSMLKCIKLI